MSASAFEPKAAKLFKEAMAAKDSDVELTFNLLDQASHIDPKMLGICEGMKGGILWQAEEYCSALPHLQQAVSLRPLASLSSLLLFKVLLEIGRNEEALAEAERFFSEFKVSGSQETQRIKDYREDYNYVKSLDG